jgi:hypothetical protein
MEPDPTPDLLAFSDHLGDPPEVPAEAVLAAHAARDAGPMSEEQAGYLNHLLRRTGRAPLERSLTFAEAKARIAELLAELG